MFSKFSTVCQATNPFTLTKHHQSDNDNHQLLRKPYPQLALRAAGAALGARCRHRAPYRAGNWQAQALRVDHAYTEVPQATAENGTGFARPGVQWGIFRRPAEV